MTQRDETLRLLSGHLQAAACLVESLLPQADAPPAGPDDPPVMACPHCGEEREEKHEDTSTDVRRLTCLSCGKSFNPAEVKRG